MPDRAVCRAAARAPCSRSRGRRWATCPGCDARCARVTAMRAWRRSIPGRVSRIRIFLKREGHAMSPDRTHRLWRQAGLQVPRRRPRRRAAPSRPRPLPPTAANHVWAYDSVFHGFRVEMSYVVASVFSIAGITADRQERRPGPMATDTAAAERTRRFVAFAFAAAARLFLVAAAFRPAARRFRVLTAFAAAVRRLRVTAALRAADLRFRVIAAFFAADAVVASQTPLPESEHVDGNLKHAPGFRPPDGSLQKVPRGVPREWPATRPATRKMMLSEGCPR